MVISSIYTSGGIPEEWTTNLMELFLARNQLSGDATATELINMRGDLCCVLIQLILLMHIEISGVIPESLSLLTKLAKLDLSQNQISGDRRNNVCIE